MKNKKSIAMAMAAVSTMGAVAPVFADQIESTLADTIDLAKVNGVRPIWAQVGAGNVIEKYIEEKYSQEDVMKEQKNIDALKLYLENKAKEVYGKDNEAKYTIRQQYVSADNTGIVINESIAEENRTTIADAKRGYLKITLIDNSDVKKAPEVFKVYGFRRDTGFGQGEVVIGEHNKVVMNFDQNVLGITKFDEETETVKTDKLSKENLHKELDKLIYEIRKEGNKISAYKVENTDIQGLDIEIYKGVTQVGLIEIHNAAKINKDLLKNIPASNDFVGHWAENAIVDAMLNNIVDVSEAFRPEDGISRAEFAKIAVNAYGVSTTTNGTTVINFSDVKEDSWDYKYIMALATRGYIKGFEGKFRPEDKITREEAAVIIAKLEANVGGINAQAKEVETVTTDKNGNAVHTSVQIKGIEDGTTVSNWADESVKILLQKKIIKGYEENGKTYFKPANNIKRAEALVMMTR